MAKSVKLDDDLKSRIHLSAEDSVVFFDAIDNPPRANDRLKAAHKKIYIEQNQFGVRNYFQ